MAAPLLSRQDLRFLLYKWLDAESLTTRKRFAAHSRDVWDAFLDLCAQIAAERFASCNKLLDGSEPALLPDGSVRVPAEAATALRAMADSGLIAASFGEEDGGLQLPATVARAGMAWYQAANAGVSNYALLSIAAANLLRAHGSAELVTAYLPDLLNGDTFGTMCLSETEAGSSLADVKTRAARDEGGSYRVTGTKMWISGGDHDMGRNIIHFVLAKIPGGPPGVKGISLFLVPKYLPDGTRNAVTAVGLNHKMGNRATVNAVLTFGDGAHDDAGQGAVGYLIGEEHQGLRYMFHMMNEARLGVGLLASAIGYSAYLKSVDYARTRHQGRPVGADPSLAPVPIVEHPDVRRMLLAQKSYVEGALALGLYCARLSDAVSSPLEHGEAQRAALLLDILTPIAKTWPSQWCLAANDLAIQVHGGYGYTRDYDVEQLYRDNRLNQIHEGTTGIQGLDLLGRKTRLHEGAEFAALIDLFERTAARAEADEDLAEYAASFRGAYRRLSSVTTALWSAEDQAVTLANSTVYLEAAGHITVSWVWLEQLLACGDRQGDFYDGKRAAARYFLRYELPRVKPQLDLLAALDRTVLDCRPAWLSE